MHNQNSTASPTENLLERLEKVTKDGEQWKALCPAHNDHNPSLGIKTGDDGLVLLNCRSRGCSAEKIVTAVGLEMTDLFPPSNSGRKNGKKGRIAATYDYRSSSGELLHQTVRFEPKGFAQRRPKENGLWEWNLKGIEPVLYHLEEVQRAVENGEPVYSFEGEKDVDRARRELGITATTCPMGAGKWRKSYTQTLEGADVIIGGDNDDAGREHVQMLGKALQGVARSVRVLELPGLSDGGDLSDWLDAGGNLDQLRELVEKAPQFSEFERGTDEEQRSADDHRQAGAVRLSALTDMGLAELFAQRHGRDLRYCYAWGQWLVWDGVRWVLDDQGRVEALAKEAVRTLYHAADPGDGRAVDRDLASFALRSQARSRIEAMIALARSEPGISVRPDELDRDPWLLNVENGTLNLRTGELRGHSRSDLLTKMAGTLYDPNAQAPAWDAVLKRVLPTEALRKFVQRVIGYALTGDVSGQVLLFLYGLGANGKSTLLNAIMEVLGDYAMQAAPELLTIKQGSHPTELADLRGARFVASVEVEDGRRLAESLVKQLTGGDRIKARFMRQDFFEFSPTHKVFLAANHKPVVRGTDHAIWRRIKLVPFDVTIPKDEQDPQLHKKLRAELPGILRWAVEGCLAWQSEGLGEPDEVRQATASYRAEMDTLAAFIEDLCVVAPHAEAKATPLYEAYKGWCDANGERCETQRRFGMRLTERGFEREKVGGLYRWYGIGLRPEGLDPEPGPTGPSGPKTNINTENHSHEAVIPNSGPNGPDSPTGKEKEGEEASINNREKPVTSVTSGTRRLTEDEAREVQKLIAEGMQPRLARAAVLGGEEQG